MNSLAPRRRREKKTCCYASIESCSFLSVSRHAPRLATPRISSTERCSDEVRRIQPCTTCFSRKKRFKFWIRIGTCRTSDNTMDVHSIATIRNLSFSCLRKIVGILRKETKSKRSLFSLSPYLPFPTSLSLLLGKNSNLLDPRYNSAEGLQSNQFK